MEIEIFKGGNPATVTAAVAVHPMVATTVTV
jgi:hypothetical protein